MRRKLFAFMLFATMLLGVNTLPSMVNTAMANPDDESVTICQSTFDESNPLAMITVSAADAFGIVNDGAPDIVPTFWYQGQQYSENWYGVGVDIFNNGCVDTRNQPPPEEVCNGIDDNGDGVIDEGCAPPPTEVPPPALGISVSADCACNVTITVTNADYWVGVPLTVFVEYADGSQDQSTEVWIDGSPSYPLHFNVPQDGRQFRIGVAEYGGTDWFSCGENPQPTPTSTEVPPLGKTPTPSKTTITRLPNTGSGIGLENDTLIKGLFALAALIAALGVYPILKRHKNS